MTRLARTNAALRALNEGSLDDPRVTVVNDDAMVRLAESASAPFDVAVVDFPDPNNFAVGKLYTTRFYRLLRAHLSNDPTVVVGVGARDDRTAAPVRAAPAFPPLPHRRDAPRALRLSSGSRTRRRRAQSPHNQALVRYYDEEWQRWVH